MLWLHFAETNCNVDMESLIADQSRCIATLSVATLLKQAMNPVSSDETNRQLHA